jgi:PcfJ-like protein
METLSTTQQLPFAIRFPAMVERCYTLPPGALANGTGIEATVHNHFAAMSAVNHTWKRETFYRLLMVMYDKKCFGVLRNPAFINILANISSFGNKTVRPIEEWTKDSLTPDGQLASLIRHLFAKYDVPQFMEYVFAESSIIHMHWYIQLGRGDSVQQLCAFPVAFTSKMAHEFRNTPGSVYTIEQAIRRAQAIGLGANKAMAETIAWSNVLDDIKDATLRTAAIRFAVKNGDAGNFAEMQMVLGYVAEMAAVDRAYSLIGRTWASVLKAANDLAADKAARLAAQEKADWAPAKTGNYAAVQGEYTFKIVQLLTAEELYEEGHEMSHCVAEYDHDCAEGRIAIFSLRKFANGTESYDTLATLEVALEENELVQAKAKFNEYISGEAEIHVLAWAKQENLSVACELYEVYAAPAQQHYQGGVPVAQLPVVAAPAQVAEMPRIAPRAAQRYDPLEEHRNRMAQQRRGGNNTGPDARVVIAIIIAVIRVLIALSKMR